MFIIMLSVTSKKKAHVITKTNSVNVFIFIVSVFSPLACNISRENIHTRMRICDRCQMNEYRRFLKIGVYYDGKITGYRCAIA